MLLQNLCFTLRLMISEIVCGEVSRNFGFQGHPKLGPHCSEKRLEKQKYCLVLYVTA